MGHSIFDMGPSGDTLVYDVEQLWAQAKHLPVREIPLSQVESELDYAEQWFKTTAPDWFKAELPTPRAVARHAQRIWDADLSCPIILSPSGMVLDGVHRIAKAFLAGHSHVKAIQFETPPTPLRVLENQPL